MQGKYLHVTPGVTHMHGHTFKPSFSTITVFVTLLHSEKVGRLPWGRSLNVSHPVSGLSSAAEQPNYCGLCFDGNRTACQYY